MEIIKHRGYEHGIAITTNTIIKFIIFNYKKVSFKRKFLQTRTIPAAYIGINIDLVMMTFRLRLKKVQNETYKRVKFGLNRLKSPYIFDKFNNMKS